MLLRYRVLTRSLLRFNIRLIKLSDRMFKRYPLSLVVIPTGCFSTTRTRGILCHSL
ncbi:hypothetical protein Hdeb2414_s0002g00055041 [Helianthus debilis subsp. tardiflorus]